MLVQLSIRDIVLIDRLDLDLGDGLTILTGETGAGKSILLDSVSLALGARGDGTLVRQGQPQGQVTAVFDLPLDHPALKTAREQDIESEGELILRRVQMADGRTRAFVNDQPVSLQTLRAVTRELVEIHGQHDDRALINPVLHRQLIDAYGGLGGDVAAVRDAYGTMQTARATLAHEQAEVEKVRAEVDYLRHADAELGKLAPGVGEETQLAERRQTMMQAEKVTSEIRDAYEAVAGQGSAVPVLSGVMRRLDRRRDQAPDLINPSLVALEAALNSLELAGQSLDQALRDARFDPRELEEVEDRLFALRAASRKYAVTVDELPTLAGKIADDLSRLDAGESRLIALQKAVVAAEAAYKKAAEQLSAKRKKTAKELDKAVTGELAPLKLENARFLTQIRAEGQGGAEGIDVVEFWVETNPGSRPGPLMKVASGGELARFMLALKVVLADRGSAPTLVFDEIDTGVGGAVADAIGQRLGRLASRVQVLAVTHAPQVAARAGHHFRIAKDAIDKGQRVATRVTPLVDAARREEIARMLAGATITEEARAAASRLMEGAG